MKEFTIYDYNGTEKTVDLALSKISVIMKYKISGDEMLEVFYKNGESELFDSCSCYRIINYFDDSELVYSADMED